MNFFKDLIDVEYKKNEGYCNLTDDFFCLFLNSILLKENKNILVVVNSLYEANKIYSALSDYNKNVYLFPMDDFLTSEAIAISPDLKINRLETIDKIINSNNKAIIITNLMGYLRYLSPVSVYKSSFIDLSIGINISYEKLINNLSSCGYTRTSIVNKTGEFAVRGFVIDVFPVDEDNPIRIEFFDDEIESIRFFDCTNQKSIKSIDSIIIKPITEFLTNKDVVENHFEKQKYLQLYESVVNISDYLGDCYTFFKDYDQIEVAFTEILKEIVSYREEKDFDFKYDYMFSLKDLIPKYPLYYCSFNNISVNSDISFMHDFKLETISNFNEDPLVINNFINKCISNNKTVVIALKEHQIRSLKKHLNMSFYDTSFDNIKLNSVNICESSIKNGFIYNDFVLLTASELYKYVENKNKYVTKYKYSTSITNIDKLDVGDYVVHNVHGIGIYNGIKTLTLNNISKDYLEVLYQGTDKIYIPVEKIDLLSKFSGRDGVCPKINKLGGVEWQKTKSRVKARVADMAQSLIKLYAERESKKGFQFSPDCDMLLEFESAFPYDLTVDQKKAILQIKEDMEKPLPMDRLLCGDVGFGKTEVAFVAAFKAILDSKQVLFLCPTTILSNQHYNNALVRFADFPVSIALLNRFTSQKDVERILKGLKEGTIDMVFGTHRLLSDDVTLKDLGLLVIDEEQRFGVRHKEKIKQYKTNVDVLTLTATPIPRTLQMSLVGIRSLSLIETPPVNRYPVQTYVVEENKQVLKNAIYKELSRKGQVFILFNRVQSILEFKHRIESLVPDARIAIAHGQMSKNELETAIYDFINYKFDILICTTIIETGIDIPNVNTLIVMDADRFGLSQLYQIRGRVGRSDKFAYAYLMYQPFKVLTETAIKRLNVIKEFTELGSGFSIATRDLSIRGAGDILGSEQAGFIDSVGVDLYLKMLDDEIKKLNNIESSLPDTDSKPLIDVTTHIDDNYVIEDELKIEVHRLINSIVDKKTFAAVKNELEDRFGRLNDDMIVYMYEELFEKLADKLGIIHVFQKRNSIEFILPKEVLKKVSVEDIFMESYKITNMFRFMSRSDNLIVILDIIKLEKHPIYYLVSLLDKINDKLENSID